MKLNLIYVTSKGDNLVVVVSPRSTIAAPEQKLSEFLHKHIITVDVMEDQQDVAQKIAI